MEEPTSEPSQLLAAPDFSPHRKCHLRSRTHSTLLRILSCCRQHSHCSRDDHVPDNDGSGLGRVTGNEVDDELVVYDTVESENTPIQIDPVACASPLGMPILKDPIVEESAYVIDLQEVGSSNVQVVMNELEQMIRGNVIEDSYVGKSNSSLILSFDADQSNTSSKLEDSLERTEEKGDVVGQSINLSSSALDNNQTTDDFDAWIDNLEDCRDLSNVIMEEDEDREQVKVSNEQNNYVKLEDVKMSIDHVNGENSEADDNNNEKGFPFKGMAVDDLAYKEQQKAMELDKSVSPKKATSPPYMMADGDIEEGEISGDLMVDDLLIEDDVESERKKVEEESISENIINKEEFTCNEQKRVNDKDSESASKIMYSVDKGDHGVEVIKSNGNQMGCKSQVGHGRRTIDGVKKTEGSDCMREGETSKMRSSGAKVDFDCPENFLDNLVFHGKSLTENTAENLSITSAKEDAGITKKRKRVISKEKRAKKKQKERKKRAEKNKELGVKRLRLLPVSKPKPVKYCRHYLKGRCQEGAQCRFSHDTTPLTKSSPCSYFARGTCMKGDDCPFDHQLSNYPCNNYVSKGFCSRGDDCLFSHKTRDLIMGPQTHTHPLPLSQASMVSLKEGSPTAINVTKPMLEPSSLPIKSNSRKLDMNSTSHQSVNSLSLSNMNKEVTTTVLKPPLKQTGTSPKVDEGVKVGNQKNQGEVQNTNVKAKATPVSVPPWGINFLSPGKAPLNDSTVKELVASPSNMETGYKISPPGDSSKYKQVGTSLTRDCSINGGSQLKRYGSINDSSQLSQSSSETIRKLNEMSDRRQPTVAPPGINFLSFGKAPLVDLSCKRQSDPPFQWENAIEIPNQERQRASSGSQSSAVPWGLPASSISSFSDRLVHGHDKATPRSAQKALLSTLAFAAKYESAFKTDQSTVAPSGSMDKEIRNFSDSEGSQNKSVKASSILDFIFSSGGKTKQ